MRPVLRPACRAALLVLLAGCGPGEPELAPVSGQVLYRGRPLAGGTVVFTPDPDRGGRGPLAVAEVGPDGRYALKTEGRPGAVAGWHRITVAPPRSAALPPRYRDPGRSGLRFEVQPGKANHHDLRLD
jgi:hypothetical protein